MEKLQALLAERYEVWWDHEIHSGDYRAEIERQLSTAKCVIPVWCRISRTGGNVVDEAEFAKRRAVPLLPVRIEDVELPIGFGSLHTIDLLGWNGESAHAGVEDLLRNVQTLLGSRARLLPRIQQLGVGGCSIALPAFFLSVSSHETPLRPEAAVNALTLFGANTLLVSAYDIIHEKSAADIVRYLETCRSNNAVVLLDSGNYEAYRKGDQDWKPEALREAIAKTPHDLFFCFDDVEPPAEVDEVVRRVLAAVERDSVPGCAPALPIVHAPRDSATGLARPDLIGEVLKRVSRELRPPLVAVPERELGGGLLARARTVYEIRRTLDELGFYQPLHLLGTGNPLSIAVFTAVGADSFDGLEWCRTAVDHGSGRLYHFQQFDFFSWQSDQLANSPVVREAVTSNKVEYSGKVVFHNLEFFQTWMDDLREHVRTGKMDRFLSDKLPGGITGMKRLEKVVPEVFG